MLLDEYNEFADATSVTGNAGTALIGDVINLKAAGLDVGNGEPIYVVVNVDTEIITGGNAGTIQFFVASDAQAAIATDGSATIHASSPSIVTDGTDANGALCKAGAYPIFAALPIGSYEQYLGILCTIGTTAVTAGKINAFLTRDPKSWKAYPDGL